MPSIASAKFVFRGDNWRKDGQYFGGHDYFTVQHVDSNLAAGTTSTNLLTVPTDTVYVLEFASMMVLSSSITGIDIRIVSSSVLTYVMNQQNPVSGQTYLMTGRLYLTAADVLGMAVFGATAGDDIYITISGLIFDLTE